MKNQVIKRLKKTLATILAMSMLAGLGIVSNAAAVSEVSDGKVVFQEVTSYDGTIPAAPAGDGAGFVFGGWFSKDTTDDTKYVPYTEKPTNGTKVYAKFVPAQVLSVKCQNLLGTKASENAGGKTSMKVISSVDSLNYSELGFELSVVTLKDDNKTWESERLLNDGDAAKTTQVYSKLGVNGTRYEAKDFFGDSAKYFSTAWVDNIPEAQFGAIICVKPYWRTLDGTQVYGLTKYAHVEDGLVKTIDNVDYRYINVPINVRDVQGVAAGVVTLNAPTGVTVVGIECGRVFQEMDFSDKQDGTVRLVGNLEKMTADVQENDIYANVRFQVQKGETEIIKGLKFTISDVDFANIAEQQFTEAKYPVWDIAY